MNKLICLLYGILFLGSGFLQAQTYRDANKSSSLENVESKANKFSLLSSQLFRSNKNTTRSVSVNNAIYVQQIGNYNSAIANTRSVVSDVGLYQTGNNNNIFMDVSAAIIDENVIQAGYNNSFVDLSRGNIVHSAAVIQRGRNQNLLWYGNNSISDKLRITMQGKKQTIIIRNIKR